MPQHDQLQASVQDVIDQAHTLRSMAFRRVIQTAWNKAVAMFGARPPATSRDPLIRHSA